MAAGKRVAAGTLAGQAAVTRVAVVMDAAKRAAKAADPPTRADVDPAAAAEATRGSRFEFSVQRSQFKGSTFC